METTTGTQNAYHQQATIQSRTNSVKRETAYDHWIAKMNFSYFGIISMTILIGSIVGGISAMFILKNNAPVWQLGLGMATAMANNVAAIGQATTKWVINLFLICIGVNALLILINVI